MTMSTRFPLLLLTALLAGCQSVPEPQPEPPAPEPARDWVSEIRERAANVPSYVEVLPLTDPGLEDLRVLARDAEAEKRFAVADQHLAEALSLVPDDPELWQWRAELALEEQRWQDAQAHARQSEAIGPKLGNLCVRNWMTLLAVSEETADSQGVAEAKVRAAQCPVLAPVRL